MDSNKTNCRFYENKFPEKDDYVMIKNKDVNEVCTIATLLEYGDLEGMITSNEYTRPNKNKSVRKAKKINKIEVAVVIAVDEVNGYIDLSTKKVDKQCKSFNEKYNKGTKVQSLLKSILENFEGIEMQELYDKLVYPYQKEKLFHDFLIDNIMEIDNIFKEVDLKKEIIDKFIEEIKRRFSPQETKIRAKFELKNFELEGVNNIRKAMRKGEEVSNKDFKIEVRMDASPMYYIITNTINKKKGIELIELALENIKKEIESTNGTFLLKEKAKILGNDEQDIEEVIDDVESDDVDEDGMGGNDLDVGEIN